MSEEQLQRAVAQLLDRLGWLYCHVPNGGARDARTGAKLKGQGVKRGVPDVLIFEEWQRLGECCASTPPGCPVCPRCYGKDIAIELKVPGRYPTAEQNAWLADLEERGALVDVCRDMDEVLAVLKHVRPRNGRRIQ
jgi:hypothetical protein